MPLGRKATDPRTPYLVYEFSHNERVFYVGHAHGNIRHTRRWSFVKNLLKHEEAGTLKPEKRTELNRKSNQVIAALIRGGHSQHLVTVAWKGLGKTRAEIEERRIILERVKQGCMLANVSDNPKQPTMVQILDYLGVNALKSPAQQKQKPSQPQIEKSSRHSKITGDFAEGLILYWLSKHGFECARIDHTGIDLIARNPQTQEVMGISVKSRSRTDARAESFFGIDRDNLDKVSTACSAFGCEPYFAFVVDAKASIYCFILTMAHFVKLNGKRKVLGLRMGQKHVDSYCADESVIAFQFDSKTLRWWSDEKQ